MDRKLARQLGFVAVLALAGHTRGALALEGDPDFWCRGGMFRGPHAQEPNLFLGRVVGKERARLLSDMDGCPLHPARGKDCHQSDTISPGTTVAVLPSTIPGLTCVLDADSPDQDQPTGWLPQARVHRLPINRDPPPTAWMGEWRKGDDTIVLTIGRDGRLSVDGQASRPGRGIAPEHTGELSGVAQPEGNRVTFGLDEAPPLCIARLELLGPDLLAATDNGQCGGANVSFGGVYTRARR